MVDENGNKINFTQYLDITKVNIYILGKQLFHKSGNNIILNYRIILKYHKSNKK